MSIEESNRDRHVLLRAAAEARRAKALSSGLTITDYVAGLSPQARTALQAHAADIVPTVIGYQRWTRRSCGAERPSGRYDNAGRWWPTAAENADGYTDYIRSPSRSWPWSYQKAAYALDHCLALDGGDETTLRLLRKSSHDVRLIDLIERDSEPEHAVQAILSALAGPAPKKVRWWAAQQQPVRHRVM